MKSNEFRNVIEQWKKEYRHRSSSSKLVELTYYDTDSEYTFLASVPGILFNFVGEVHYQIGDDEVRVIKQGEYLFYPKGVSINFEVKKGTIGMFFPLTKEITEQFVDLLQKYKGFSQDLIKAPNRVCIFHEPWSHSLEQLLLTLMNHYMEEENSDFFIHLTLCEILYHIFPNEHMLSKISYVIDMYYYPETIQSVESYLLQNYFQPIRIKNILDEAKVSETHLNRLYRKYFQMSPMERLTAIRMEQAALLLKNQGLTVTDVAVQVGYQSMSAFVQQFKKRFNMSPKEYQSSLGR